MTAAEATRQMADGSMKPKMHAIVWPAEAGGKEAIITNPEDVACALKGETGTRIVRY
jgi:carbamate kinase